MAAGVVRVGVGGWSYAPWRNNFYPAGLPHGQELSFSSARLSAIEINATFYRTQTPDIYRRWAGETPDDFMFSVKAHRLTTHRKLLAGNADAVAHFLESGIVALGDKLGPIVWQFAPTKRFEPDDFEAFLSFLPATVEGRAVRHVLEVRHASFCAPAFVALARRFACAICFTDSHAFPNIADLSADFVYARLQQSSTAFATGYAPGEIERWGERALSWAAGSAPADLSYVGAAEETKRLARDVFIFFIAGAKENNPAAACALIERLAARV